MSEWRKHLEESLAADPELRREFERLRPQYELAKQCWQFREEAGLSQAELAERMGKQQPAIARLEAARVVPSIAFLQQLAEALDLRLVVRLEPKSVAESAPLDSRNHVDESTEPVREKATA